MDIIQLSIFQFSLIYLLLLLVLAIMKKAKIDQTRLLIYASFRMSIQLYLAGLVLTYILKNPHPLFTVAYIIAMTAFATARVLGKHKELNPKFKLAIGLSLAGAGTLVVLFFVQIVVGTNFFNPQYTIPLSGMIFGNAMTGLTLALRTFSQELKAQRNRIDSLLYVGVSPQKILLPFVNNALETALLPTLNSMMGMGIISLPGMMTGQILSGTLPMTAILYQIAIMIAITTVVCLAVFSALYFGYHTLYNKQNQILF